MLFSSEIPEDSSNSDFSQLLQELDSISIAEDELQQLDSSLSLDTPHETLQETLQDSLDTQDSLHNQLSNAEITNQKLLSLNHQLSHTLQSIPSNLTTHFSPLFHQLSQHHASQSSTILSNLLLLHQKLSFISSKLPIFSNYAKQKELDILTIKKQLLSLKQQQLMQLKLDFNSQSQDMANKYQKDINNLNLQYSQDRSKYQSDLDSCHSQISLLKSQLYDTQRKPRQSDFQQQFQSNSQSNLHNLSQKINKLLNLPAVTTPPNVPIDDEYILNIINTSLDNSQHSKSQLESQLDSCNHKIDSLTLDLEISNSKLKSIEKLHAQEIKLLNTTHSAEISNSKPQTLNELEKQYPKLLEEYKNNIYLSFQKESSEYHQKQASSTNALIEKHQSLVSDLINKFENEKEILNSKHQEQLLKVTKHNLSDESNHELQKCRTDRIINELQMKIKSLEFENQKKIEAETNNSQLALIKAKYVSVLQRMKEDLIKSKKDGWEKLEREWQKRMKAQEQEWSEKLLDIKYHIRTEHANCYCINFFKYLD